MTKLKPWTGNGTSLLARMQGEMEDLFQRTFGPVPESAALSVWTPSVDVEETDKAIVVKADLPGVDAKDIDVSIQNGALILRGEKKEEKEEKEEKGKDYHRVERSYGSFYRAVALPAEADEAGVSASTAKGVVTVTIPKKPAAQTKKIPVQAKD